MQTMQLADSCKRYQESNGHTISTSFGHLLTEGTKVIGRKAQRLASSRQN
jgi:hypothetical protein